MLLLPLVDRKIRAQLVAFALKTLNFQPGREQLLLNDQRQHHGRIGRCQSRILKRFPFLVKELHPDNGTEFFNAHLVRFWGEEITGLKLSRSRPYQKNDHRLVEQKNDTLVRQYFGTSRLETPEQVQAMNILYDKMKSLSRSVIIPLLPTS